MRVGTSGRGWVLHGPVGLCTLLLALALAPAPAQGSRALLSEAFLQTSSETQIEGACGLAVSPGGDIYVSDYYHGEVDVFSPLGEFKSQINAAEPPEGPCGLAIDTGGALYANVYHQRVESLLPTVTIDNESSTGVAVDPATNRLYVDDRTYIAVYEPSGEAVMNGLEPLRIGLGNLEDAYGVAVSGERLYVAEAKDDTIKIFKPALSITEPQTIVKTTPQGHFVSLKDATVAVDPSNGHLLVADNLEPGFVHPTAAIYEFKGTGGYLGKLAGAPVDGEPTGIAAAADGTLYVTDGNDEEANVFKYSPYEVPAPEAAASAPEAAPAGTVGVNAPESIQGQAQSAAASSQRGKTKTSHAQAQLVQKGPIRIAVSGSLAPKRLPRTGTAPITVRIGGQISYTSTNNPPQLQKVSFAFNRAGRLDAKGLARCALSDIDPSTSQQALEACRDSKVGEGQFSANVLLPEQSPFPSAGKVLAFNGTLKGKQVIFAHIYGTQPVPTSVVLPLEVRKSKGTFGTRLDASLAKLTGDWGYVTGISLKLGRKYSFHGERHSFLSAGCPAPKGFPGALFPLARTTFSFAGGRNLSATLTRSCVARG